MMDLKEDLILLLIQRFSNALSKSTCFFLFGYFGTIYYDKVKTIAC